MILALIQARMASTRLPGKSMALIENVPLIEHVVRRVQAAKYVSHVCVCTTVNAIDDPLAAHIESIGVDAYRGSEDDVLGRFYWASQLYPDANPIVRITGDDVFKDPELIDYTLTGFLGEWAKRDDSTGRCDYMKLGGDTWPLGMDVEVFSRSALEIAYKGASGDENREHVTPWMAEVFRKWLLKNPDVGAGRVCAAMQPRWTVDTEEDLEFAREVYAKLYAGNPVFGYREMCEAGV